MAIIMPPGAAPAAVGPAAWPSSWRVPPNATASVADGGAVLLSFGGKPHPPSIVLVSSFSEPGPTWHNLSQHPASEWTHLSVNRSTVGSEAPDSSGLQLLAHVDAVRPGWKLQRSVWISLPLQHGGVSAVFVNDTLTVTGAAVRGFWVSHAALLVGAEPATAILPGLSNAYQCDATYDHVPGDLSTNLGRPDVFVNSTSGDGVGLTALDDVFRAHAMAQNFIGTFGSSPRPSTWDEPPQPCPRSDPPSVLLTDPHLALAPGVPYTMQWAALPSDAECSDYWCYINRLRQLFGNQGTITIPGTGILPFMPTNTTCIPAAGRPCTNTTYRGEPEMLSRWGYDDPHWESFSPQEMAELLDHQGVHYVVSHNGNWGPECTCGPTDCLNDVDGAQFVHSLPPMMEEYMHTLVRQVHAANQWAREQPGTEPSLTDTQRMAMVYIETYISTQPRDPITYKESAVTAADGEQVFYVECDSPHGKPRDPNVEGSKFGDLPLFFANRSNAYGRMLLAYVDKALSQFNFSGIYHGARTFSKGLAEKLLAPYVLKSCAWLSCR